MRIRFRLSTDASGTADGWWVDDIACGEAPDAVDASAPTEITSSSMRVPWLPSTNENFSHYVVVRSTSPGVHINSTLSGMLYDRGTNGWTDTGLTLDTFYYYRVYAVSRQGVYSANGTEAPARTLNNPVPFVESFEGALSAWEFSGAWGATTNQQHGGSTGLVDSPGGAYTNNGDSSARTAVNLAGSVWPALTFWDRYSVAGGDWAMVEVSSDGVNWSRVYAVSGSQGEWRRKRVDLSPWKNATNLRIRFRLASDWSGTDDGWYVDDVSVQEHGGGGVGLPFYERFEDGGLSNWLSTSWRATTNLALDGGYSAVDTEGWTYGPDASAVLALERELNLAGATNPVLTVWMRGQLWYRTRLRVQMSSDGGVSWGDLAGWNHDQNWTSWTRVQVVIPAGYRVNGARLRLITWSEASSQPDQNWYVDKLTMEEMPSTVLLYTPDERTTHSMQVTWTPYTSADFESYRIYRSTSAGVSEASTLIATLTNALQTNQTIAGLQALTRYYFRIYVVNTNGTTVGSNETFERTRGADLPFADGFEASVPVWTFSGAWGLQAGAGRSGGKALTDSPGNYSNNTASSAVWDQLDQYDMAGAAILGSRFDR